jgi:hypothetical protein
MVGFVDKPTAPHCKKIISETTSKVKKALKSFSF